MSNPNPITHNKITPHHYDKEKNLYILSSIKGNTSLGPFAEGVRRLIYKRSWYLVDTASFVVRDFMKGEFPEKKFDVVAPAPLLQYQADYAPEILLADWVATHQGLELCKLKLTGAIREFSSDGAFFKRSGEISCPKQVEGKSILLLAAVMGNGVTIDLCSEALRKAGAKDVTTIALVRHEH